MKDLKKITLQLPEYILLAAVVFYWFSAGVAVNYVAITLVIGLILQLADANEFLYAFGAYL